ncbi:hypothetical protein DIPPA_33364 [Diplonema papillatum]|nr:hypothetical protein DIPPA_33364 [Diplonema papillatum]
MVRVQKKAAGNKAVKRSAEGVENSPEKKAKNEKVDATSLKPGELKVKAALDAICTLAKDDLPVVDSDRIGLVETLESKLGFSIPEDLRYYWLLTKTEFFDGVQEVKQALKAFTDEEECAFSFQKPCCFNTVLCGLISFAATNFFFSGDSIRLKRTMAAV